MTNAGISTWDVSCGDARVRLRELPSASVDLLLTDPPYPEIDRFWGRLTVREWKFLIADVVTETRRVLKPTGSAVFVIQPNSEHVGRMRAWAFQFMAWIASSWNMVQDVWWWNIATLPTVHANRKHGLLRTSVKACVWAGEPTCYRNQDAVLWEPSHWTLASRKTASARLVYKPSGHHQRQDRAVNTSIERGGTTPFNLIPAANTDYAGSSAAVGHGAGTPFSLASWWVRYACPRGGLVVDPFCGAGTVGLAALEHGASFRGYDQDKASVDKASTRLLNRD